MIAIEAIRRGAFWPALRDPVLSLIGLAFTAVAIVSALVNAIAARTAPLGLLMTIDAIAIYFVARMVPAGDRARWPAPSAAIVAVAVAVARSSVSPRSSCIPTCSASLD